MLELFLNTVTRRWYDKDGDPFGDGMPQGAYLSREDVKITLCKETPDAGATGVDVSTWTRDDSLASVSGVGAMLTIDSDRVHKLKGELSGEVSAGAVSTITATIENASNATVPESGTLRLFDESGDYEAIAYTDRSIVDGEATFTVSGSVSGSYAVGSVIDCDQSPYAQAYLDTSASNLEQGELVFYLVIDSQRLRAEMDYSDVETLSIAGLELLIYRTADGASEPVTAYLCETYSVTGTLGSVGNESQPPDATADKLAGLVDQLLAAGLDVEQQYDSEGNTQFRVRSVSAGGTWSDWITVQKGEPGADGKSFSVDATGTLSERSQYDAEAAGFSFLATDEGNLYIKNSDSSGDWSDAIPFQGPAGADGEPGPANTLTIGTVTTGEPGTQAAASITGESPNQVLNLTIPRGDKGETGEGGGTAAAVAWDDITDKPSSFTPADHTHEISDVNGLQLALDAKGTVKSVNGVEPDSSGNVTIEAGGGGGETGGARIEFTSAPGNVVTAESTANVICVLDDSGVAWFPSDEELSYTDSSFAVDLSGILAKKGIASISGTWQLLVTGGATVSVDSGIPESNLLFYAPLTSEKSEIGPLLANSGATFEYDATLKQNVAKFDGSSMLSFQAAGLPYGTTPHTKSMWIKFTQSPANYVFPFSWGAETTNNASTFAAYQGKWAWCFGGDWQVTDVEIPLNTWICAVMTNAYNMNTLYINGEVAATTQRSLNVTANGTGGIGAYLNPGWYLTGMISSIRVWDRVLTQNEIKKVASEFNIAG